MLYKIIDTMKSQGIMFSKEISNNELDEIEKVYDIKFPESLREFYKNGIPFSSDNQCFPNWNNFENKNIENIKERMKAPYNWLFRDVKNDFWLPKWGEKAADNDGLIEQFAKIIVDAPKLIPIYSHRYMPIIDGADNPPVISTVGRDTIYYGSNLIEYLQNEFIHGNNSNMGKCSYVPFWEDIIYKLN